MKKFSFLMMALVMALGLTQCKKPVVNTNVGGYAGTTQHVTFSNVNDGAKVDMENDAKELNLTWSEGDVLQVYGSATNPFSGGQYCGSLTMNPEDAGSATATFTGSLDNVPAVGGMLRFYYFASGCNFDETTHKAEVDLTTQNGKLDGTGSLKEKVVVYVDLPVNTTAQYSGDMGLPYGVVKFDMNDYIPESGSIDMTMTVPTNGGMKFNANGTWQNVAGTNITLSGVSAENADNYIVAVVPFTDKTICLSGNGKTGSRKISVEENKFYTKTGSNGEGVLIPLIEENPGSFTVSTGHKVYFSKGNLQYLGQAAEGSKWRFAEKQWHVLGTGPGSQANHGNVDLGIAYKNKYNTGSGKPTPDADDEAAARDLFGWGTSGYFHQQGVAGNFSYLPYATVNDSRGEYFAYGYNNNNLNSQSPATADWGYNTIEGTTGWRTLTGGPDGEWDYILHKRSDGSGNRLWGMATVVGTKGLVILPDDWATPTGYTFKYGTFGAGNEVGGGKFTDNTFTEADWTVMEAAGAIFLPTTGYRSADIKYDVDSNGYYWSSTNCPSGNKTAYDLQFYNEVISPIKANHPKGQGRAVRLVKDCE